MLESGIIYDHYEFQIGREYIHSVTCEYGKKNERRRLTKAGKEAAKDIANKTERGTMRRHLHMGEIWNNPHYSVDV